MPTARAEDRQAIDALAVAVDAVIHAGEAVPPAVAVAYRAFAVAHAPVCRLAATRQRGRRAVTWVPAPGDEVTPMVPP